MRKIRASVKLVVLLAGAGGLASYGCGSSSSAPPVTTGTGGTTGGAGIGGGAGAGGGGISFGNKDGGAATGGGGGISFGNKDGGAATGGTSGGTGGTSGGTGGSGGPIGATVALQDFGAAFAQVFCDKAYTCCTAAELMGFPPTSAECQTTLAPELQMLATALQSSVTAGRIIYHGDKMAACLKATQAQSCADARTGMSVAGAMTNCDGAFEPKVALGSACTDSAECIGGFCGVTDPNAAMGICVAKVANGSPCGSDGMCTSDNCGASKVCEPPAPSGGLCQ
jgi:hypothetical protein